MAAPRRPSGPAGLSLSDFEARGFQPYDVTRAEWVAIQRAHRRSLGQPEEDGTPAAPYSAYEEYHRDAVRRALAAGVRVRPRVLKDYRGTPG